MVLHYRVDERVIHGQTTTRITKEFVCNGIIIVDDEISQNKFKMCIRDRCCNKIQE